MSLVDDLLTVLSSYSAGYKLMRRRIAGYPGPALSDKFDKTSGATLKVTLSRLKRKGLVDNQDGIWRITKKGNTYLADKTNFHNVYGSKRQTTKNVIVAFDIPEHHKRKRVWLRVELKNLGFKMLQKSIWFGPAPLPKEFVKTLNDLNLLDFIKFFEVKEKDII
ncbi:MAG: hypothetical protein Q7K44_04875 [Candidatus Liptonbacteria bacterium]|nr:hypothetical protein [Candidatus Liptonbacteria bacterium]